MANRKRTITQKTKEQHESHWKLVLKSLMTAMPVVNYINQLVIQTLFGRVYWNNVYHCI